MMEQLIFDTIYEYYPRFLLEDSAEYRKSREFQTFKNQCIKSEVSKTLTLKRERFSSRLKVHFPNHLTFDSGYAPFIHAPYLEYTIQLAEPPHVTQLLVRQSILTTACCILFYEFFEWEQTQLCPISSLTDEATTTIFRDVIGGRVSLWDGSLSFEILEVLTTPRLRFIPLDSEIPFVEIIEKELKSTFNSSLLSLSLLQTIPPDIKVFDNMITNQRSTVFQCLFSNFLN
jgi:hypothetical protein